MLGAPARALRRLGVAVARLEALAGDNEPAAPVRQLPEVARLPRRHQHGRPRICPQAWANHLNPGLTSDGVFDYPDGPCRIAQSLTWRPPMRFVRHDGSFNHQAIETAFRARLRHYTLFDEKVPGVITAAQWKKSVMDA